MFTNQAEMKKGIMNYTFWIFFILHTYQSMCFSLTRIKQHFVFFLFPVCIKFADINKYYEKQVILRRKKKKKINHH